MRDLLVETKMARKASIVAHRGPTQGWGTGRSDEFEKMAMIGRGTYG